MPNCLSTQPSVQGKTAVGETLRSAVHGSDLMHQRAGEKDDLVLLRNNRLVAALADVNPFFQPRIMDPQFAAFEPPRLLMEEINERQMATSHSLAGVIAVEVEEIAVIAGGDLRLHAGN